MEIFYAVRTRTLFVSRDISTSRPCERRDPYGADSRFGAGAEAFFTFEARGDGSLRSQGRLVETLCIKIAYSCPLPPTPASLRLRRGPRLAQPLFHHLAIGIARQRLRGERHRLRHLVVRKPFGAPGAQGLSPDVAVPGHDHGVDTLAQHRTGFGDDGALDDIGMAGEHGFDLGGIDLQPAAIDHVFLPIEHPNEILLVDRTEVARMPEAASKTFRRRRRVIPVAFDDRARANPDFADLAARQLTTLRIHHHDMRARARQPDAVDMAGVQ